MPLGVADWAVGRTIQELQALLLKAEERNRQIEDVLLAQSA